MQHTMRHIHPSNQALTFFIFILLFPLIFFSCTKQGRRPITIEIKDNWNFRAKDDSMFCPATVPGCIHTDLLANELIEDPFYRMNERDVQWIDKKDWVYQTRFVLTDDMLERNRKDLIFEGLDTRADVFLNDSLILEANNMYRTWICPVNAAIHPGENELKIVFHSPIDEGLRILREQAYSFPVSANDQSELGGIGDQRVSIFLRKAPYHFGWDWGPRLVTSGIWKPIVIRAWAHALINNIFIGQTELSDILAQLTVHAEFISTTDGSFRVEVLVNGELQSTQEIELKSGAFSFEFPIQIKNPQRWWTNGLGSQTLYDIEVRLLDGKHELDSKLTKTGLRTLELIQDKDSIGESFYFKVNGHPVFMKGANMIPLDIFLPRIKTEDYQRIIQSAKDAHINMLRVWGGGIYESDIFYDLCDNNGILVWQDFMFACSMIPGDSAYLENVKQEAIDNIIRLRNHPSLALWCGNNEVLSAWNNWGWKNEEIKKQGQEVADKIWNNYDRLFHHILPEVVHTYDPGRSYHPSSPGGKAGVTENPNSGDMHYWMVWWGKEPFEHYEKVIPRFMSEYGFQSFPDLSTINKFATPDDWGITSGVMKAHQRSSIGNETIEEYMLRDFRPPVNFPMFLYVNQVLQARGITMAMEAHRKHMPQCMGSLYWQLNDVWPVASWSGIDYYGHWKALYYAVEKSFRDVILVPDMEDGILDIHAISDRLDSLSATLNLTLFDFSGKILNQWDQFIILPPNASSLVYQASWEDFSKKADTTQIVLLCHLTNGEGSAVAEKLFYFAKPKNLLLKKPNIESEFKQSTDHQIEITLQGDYLANNIYFQTDIEGFFSDNYFDILPQKQYSVIFTSKEKLTIQQLHDHLTIVSLWDSYQEE